MQGLDFIAVDVETANSDQSSVCQVGLAVFRNGKLTKTWRKFCNPLCSFDAANVAIHGIEMRHVVDAPKLQNVILAMSKALAGHVFVAHSGFDNRALRAAADLYNIVLPANAWIDTVKVSRLVWPDLPDHRLRTIATELSIDFRHHDALEDAIACGTILTEASKLSGYGVDEWLLRQSEGVRRGARAPSLRQTSWQPSPSLDGDPDGPLSGEVVVFTGAISLERNECARLAAAVGCDVRNSVSGKTTLLVVGEQDLRYTKGQEKSTKHRKAEELIAAGLPIRIIGETEFIELVRR